MTWIGVDNIHGLDKSERHQNDLGTHMYPFFVWFIYGVYLCFYNLEDGKSSTKS